MDTIRYDSHGYMNVKVSCGLAFVSADIQFPGVPGRPLVVRVIGKKVTIQWTAPNSDGGSKITHYVIHYGTADLDLESFVKRKITGRKTTCIISRRIRRNEEYKFAVAAENKDGVGQLSEFSDWIKTTAVCGRHVHLYLCCADLMNWVYVKRML